MILVYIYLLAVVLANMIILWFGPQSAVITAFLFIGLDLTLRDKLHDQWHGKQLCWKMLALICVGSAISIALNWNVLPIALASATALFSGWSRRLASLCRFTQKTFHDQGKWFKCGRQCDRLNCFSDSGFWSVHA